MASEWYIRVGNAEHGPLSSLQLVELVRQGKIQPTTRLRRSTDANWIAASQINGLFNGAHRSQTTSLPQSSSPASDHLTLTNDSRIDRSNKWIWRIACVGIVLLCELGIHAAWKGKQRAKQVRIETANQEVREAVEKAKDWIRDGLLSDADPVIEELHAAAANAVATEKGSVSHTLENVQRVKSERQADQILRDAMKAISKKQFDRARTALPQYVSHPYAREKQKAQTLIAEIDRATSDEDALRTLMAMSDSAFTAFSKGDISSVVFSHPTLAELRVNMLKKYLAEAGRQREERRKRAEAERIAEQKRIDAEREAAKQREAEKEEERRRKQAAEQAKQESERTISYEVLRTYDAGDSTISMSILVREGASRQDVLKLAESLRRKYTGRRMRIDIFDSREAWQNRDNENYPEKKFWRHYLVQIGGYWSDGKEIHWVGD